MSDCNICTEKYNKTKRSKIICSCGFESCRTCVKEYITNKMKDHLEEAHCMSCKIPWTRKFMYDNFEKNFMNGTYKYNYENLLLEKELSLLQITQPYVEKEIKIEECKKKLDNLNIESKELEREYLIKKKELIQSKQKLNDELQETIYNFNDIEVKKFSRKCPNNDCHGFLDFDYKCDLCNSKACTECYELLDESNKQHVCDSNTLESIKLLKQDSRPCPKCSSMIYKINGCDQIFCVECHTAWNWKTGYLITNNIHNPHYFEYVAERNRGITPRDPLDVLCGREIDEHFIKMLHKTVEHTNNQYEFFICDVARNIMHIRFGYINRFQDEHYDNYCKQLRINYMRNKITKEEFKNLIQKRNKELKKKKEIFDILIMFINSMTDIFYILLNQKKYNIEDTSSMLNWNNAINEMYNLKKYTNESLEDVCRSYNCKFYFINETFEFII